MAELFSKLTPWSLSLGATVDKIRRRSSATLVAALGPSAEATRPALPTLQGEALAKRHLNLALEALHEVGMSKPTRFRKLRLLINKVEQGYALPAPVPGTGANTNGANTNGANANGANANGANANGATVVSPPPVIALSRRARLMNRAIQSPIFATLRTTAAVDETISP